MISSRNINVIQLKKKPPNIAHTWGVHAAGTLSGIGERTSGPRVRVVPTLSQQADSCCDLRRETLFPANVYLDMVSFLQIFSCLFIAASAVTTPTSVSCVTRVCQGLQDAGEEKHCCGLNARVPRFTRCNPNPQCDGFRRGASGGAWVMR